MPGLKERLTLSPELPIPPLNSDFSFKSIRIPFLYTSDSWCMRVCTCGCVYFEHFYSL